MTAAEFRARFREFSQATPTDAQVDAALAEAERDTSDSFSTPAGRRDDVVALRAARILALSPWGQAARLVGANGKTVYDARLDEHVTENGVRQRSF